MRKLQITLIALFLAVATAFCAVFLHDRLTADHTAPRIVWTVFRWRSASMLRTPSSAPV